MTQKNRDMQEEQLLEVETEQIILERGLNKAEKSVFLHLWG